MALNPATRTGGDSTYGDAARKVLSAQEDELRKRQQANAQWEDEQKRSAQAQWAAGMQWTKYPLSNGTNTYAYQWARNPDVPTTPNPYMPQAPMPYPDLYANLPHPDPYANLSHFAGGGVSPGGYAVVGEHGPELTYLPQGTRVFPHQRKIYPNLQAMYEDSLANATGVMPNDTPYYAGNSAGPGVRTPGAARGSIDSYYGGRAQAYATPPESAPPVATIPNPSEIQGGPPSPTFRPYFNPFTGVYSSDPFPGLPEGGYGLGGWGNPGTGPVPEGLLPPSWGPGQFPMSPYGPNPYATPTGQYYPGGSIFNLEQLQFASNEAARQALLTGHFQPMGPNGLPSGPSQWTFPAATSYAQLYGYDPNDPSQLTLAGQSQEEQRNQAILNRLGRYTPTMTPYRAPRPGGFSVQRDNVGPAAAAQQRFENSAIGTPAGEADISGLERLVYGDPTDPAHYPASPYADMIRRGEDPGPMAQPHERALARINQQKRYQANGGGLPFPAAPDLEG